ncbi:hypothetical protein QNH36_09960 [Mesobacillus sp. AQ2]|uniref:hypothetical protein n=1 Tax=Mesobacillus sp. AQ2 TaxID=3043332 RepID=UPI0024C1E44F|nr:hypothetical protein [Mesobacillus sp. AQ2]WHX42427.1 hypothetical protein QNH36_09960 [Mesobacillus sp. AQ2]
MYFSYGRSLSSNGIQSNNNDSAGVFYSNRNNKQVRATIDFEDLCRADRRCIINDLVAGAQDENDRDRDDRKCGCRD